MHTTSTATAVVHVDVAWYKPLGRGRKFQRAARGLARRMRLPFVRETLWEKAHPEASVGRPEVQYLSPWTSTNALTNFSFACACHKRERYSRKRRT